MYVSDHEYVVNLDPSVKTLIFGARINIHDAVGIYEDAMKEYSLGPNNEILDGFHMSPNKYIIRGPK